MGGGTEGGRTGRKHEGGRVGLKTCLSRKIRARVPGVKSSKTVLELVSCHSRSTYA